MQAFLEGVRLVAAPDVLAALVLASIYALVRIAGRVYAQGLLHAGSRLHVRTAWRLTHQRD